MESIENIRQFARALEAAAQLLDSGLDDVLKQPVSEMADAAADPAERIALYNGYAYVLVLVLFAYLKSVGIATESHPVMKDLDRVKSYVKKLKLLQQNEETAHQKEQRVQDQASRFLQQSLGVKWTSTSSVPSEMTRPAVSERSFKGKHTRFDDENNKKESTISKPSKSSKSASPAPQLKKYKVTKPKRK